ncbi:hypothetical protein [Nonomuraea typhae]|uniref:Uncharacterized protein n=1 Tax=Nonomuraea typhae TaxID=2603600 RepID=A0ABW7YKU4_9ACTN
MSYRTSDYGIFWVSVVLLALMLGGGVILGVIKANTGRVEVLTVQEKDRVCDGGSSGACRYLIFSDKGVFENTDSLFAGKWDSSDLQNQLKIGQTYEVEARGWRIPLFSAYPNIIQIQREVTQ